MKKILWFIKQLFPMIYYSTYEQDNKKYFHILNYLYRLIRELFFCKEKIYDWRE